jgi:hypothetical protein
MNLSDSVRFYENLLKQELPTIKDDYLLASSYTFLSNKAKAFHEMDSAYTYLQKSSQIKLKIREEQMKHSVYDVQQRYDFEKEKNYYNGRSVTRLKRIVAITILLWGAANIIVIVIRRLLIRRKKEAELQEKILQLNQEVAALMKQMTDNQAHLTENSNLKKHLRTRIDLVHSIARKENDSQFMSNKTFLKTKEMVYGSKTQFADEAIFDIFRDAYSGYYEMIKKSYPQLIETEFKVCVLSFLPMSTTEIAGLLGLSENTAGKYRTSIRKKLGLEEKGGNFCQFITNKMGS